MENLVISVGLIFGDILCGETYTRKIRQKRQWKCYPLLKNKLGDIIFRYFDHDKICCVLHTGVNILLLQKK